jgi:hypothetical protein
VTGTGPALVAGCTSTVNAAAVTPQSTTTRRLRRPALVVVVVVLISLRLPDVGRYFFLVVLIAVFWAVFSAGTTVNG